jgi:hypothetical protein
VEHNEEVCECTQRYASKTREEWRSTLREGKNGDADEKEDEEEDDEGDDEGDDDDVEDMEY